MTIITTNSLDSAPDLRWRKKMLSIARTELYFAPVDSGAKFTPIYARTPFASLAWQTRRDNIVRNLQGVQCSANTPSSQGRQSYARTQESN